MKNIIKIIIIIGILVAIFGAGTVKAVLNKGIDSIDTETLKNWTNNGIDAVDSAIDSAKGAVINNKPGK